MVDLAARPAVHRARDARAAPAHPEARASTVAPSTTIRWPSGCIDIEFHQALNIDAGNGYLAALAQGLYDVALDVRRMASAVPGVIKTSVAQHCDVADAIIAHDADAAVAAYRRTSSTCATPPSRPWPRPAKLS